jgi:magnesium transporter
MTSKMIIREFSLTGNKRWIDIQSPSAAELDQFAESHKIHQQNLTDCLESDHLPKFEDTEPLQFLITRVIVGNTREDHTVQEISSKVAMFFDENTLITVHRLPHDFIEDMITRYIEPKKIHQPKDIAVKLIKGSLRSFERFTLTLNEQIDHIEDTIFIKTRKINTLQELYFLKRQSNIGRKLLLLTREVLTGLQGHHKASADLQDAFDLHNKVELYFDQLAEDVNNLLTVYLSVSSQKTNEVMKVLTVFSAFFLPLTFLVGVYGMNFKYMPELDSPWGYPGVLALMLGIVIFIYVWFRRKKWL